MSNLSLTQLNLKTGDVITETKTAIIDNNFSAIQTNVNNNSNKIGDLNGLTETDLASAIKNDRSQLSDIAQYIDNTLGLTVTDMIGISYPLALDEDLATKLLACGFKYYRVDLVWSYIETTTGVYNFSNSTMDYDAINSILIAHGFIPYYILGQYNSLYGSEKNITTTAMRNGFKNYVLACVNHFKNQNCIWEVYNEPNAENHWENRSGTDYSNVVKDVYELIKSTDLTGTVSCGTLGYDDSDYDFFEEMCKNDVLNYTDVLSLHPYTTEAPETRKDYYDKFYSIIGKYTDREIPIYCGEVGYSNVPSWDGVGTPAVVNTEIQAKFTIRTILTNIMFNITKTMIYTALDRNGSESNVENYFGIFTYNREDKASATLLKNVIVPIKDYYFIKRMLSQPNNYILKFVNSNKNVAYVAWTTENSNTELINGTEVTLTDTPQLIITTDSEISLSNNEFDAKIRKAKYSAIAKSQDNIDSYASEIFAKNKAIDLSGSPGSAFLMGGDSNAGFFGLVSPLAMGLIGGSAVLSGSTLASNIGLSTGTSFNVNVPLMKFIYKGKIIFIPLTGYRHGVSWDDIYNRGAVYGSDDEGTLPPNGRIGTDLSINASDNSINCTKQYFAGDKTSAKLYADAVGVVGDTLVLKGWTNSANNATVTIVSITDTKIVVSGATLISETGNTKSRVYNSSKAVTQSRQLTIGNFTYRVRLMKGAGSNPLNSYSDSYRGTIGSDNEWNSLVLPLHERSVKNDWAFTQYAMNANYEYNDTWGVLLTDTNLRTINTAGLGSYTWCQEVADTYNWRRAFRGGAGTSFINIDQSWNNSSTMCWRPVLELIQ